MNTETNQNIEIIELDALLEAIDQDYRTATQIARFLGVAPDMNLLDTIDEFCADGKLKRFDLGIHTIFARPGTEATRVIMMDGKAIIPPAGVTYEDAYAQLLKNRTQNPAPVPPPKPNYKAPYPKKFKKKETVDAVPEPKVDHRKRGRPTGGPPKWGPDAFRDFGREGLGLKEIAEKLDLQINTVRKHKLRPENQKAYIEGLAEFDDAQREEARQYCAEITGNTFERSDAEPPEPKDQFENNWQEGGIEIPFDESPFNVSKMTPKERTAAELSGWSLPRHSLPPEPMKEVGSVTTTEPAAADPEKKNGSFIRERPRDAGTRHDLGVHRTSDRGSTQRNDSHRRIRDDSDRNESRFSENRHPSQAVDQRPGSTDRGLQRNGRADSGGPTLPCGRLMNTTLINDLQWHQECVLYAEREIRFQQAKLAEAQAKLAAVESAIKKKAESAIKKKAESPFFKCVNPQCPRSAECWTFNRPQVDPKRRLDFQFEIDSEGDFHCDEYDQF